MELNWYRSVLYGLLSGLMDILPVSSQAHKVLLLKFWGVQGKAYGLQLVIHLAIFGALYFSEHNQLVRMSRARALARVPKRKRKRPLDVRSLMDLSMLRTMLIPVMIGLFFFQYTPEINNNLMLIAVFLFLNGLILYVPQFLPSSNRDSRTLSRVEGFLMGLGGTISILPGMSAIGVSTSVGSVCGVERSYGLTMALLMNLFLTAGLAVYDIMAIFSHGLEILSFGLVVRYILTAASAFGGTLLGVKIMRYLAAEHSYVLFAFYCFGLSLFTFILNLMT